MFEATLRNRSQPELGSLTISFPIPEERYENVIFALKNLQIGDAGKQDFAVRAGLVESQRLFSDEQLAVIRNACAFALEDDATLSYAEEKQLQSVQEQIELLLPQQEQEQHHTMEQTM